MTGRGRDRPPNVVASGPGSVGVGGDVNAPITTNVHLVRTLRTVTFPLVVGVLPPEPDCPQRRASVVLDSAPVTVLRGLGGVGKTQAAAQYARDRWAVGDLDLLVWIPASSRSAVVAGFAEAMAAVSGAEPGGGAEAAARFLAWLAGTPRRWLVVLDDVAAPDDVDGLWPPVTGTGITVVTTRRRESALRGTGRDLVDVDVFTPEEAVAYIRERLGDRAAPDEVDALAADLGCLPLALAQVTTYLADQQLDVAAYRRRFADRRRRLADLLPDRTALPDGHATTVGTVWSLSVQRADDLSPRGAASVMLALLALLDANGVPAAVLTTPRLRDYFQLCGVVMDSDAVAGTLTALHRLSLVTFDRDEPIVSVRVHPLVQRATREQLTQQRFALAAWSAATALYEAWPEVEGIAAYSQALRANALALISSAGDALWDAPAGPWYVSLLTRIFRIPVRHGHPVLFQVGQSLAMAGQQGTAVEYYRDLRRVAERRYGPAHRDTLTTRAQIAAFAGRSGDAAVAATEYGELVADAIRALGRRHPLIRDLRNNLAHWKGKAGDPGGAVADLETLLAERRKTARPDDIGVLNNRLNLAYWRRESGDVGGAVHAFIQLLDEVRRALGPEHILTLGTRSNLAESVGLAGDAAGAARAYEELLPDRVRIMGADHLDTLNTHATLARWLAEAGEADRAADTYRTLLAEQSRVLGIDHPATAATRVHLSGLKH
jgi:hypothetical protein